MTAIDFPNSPTVDDLFTVGDRTWKWTGSVWITVEEAVVGPAGVVASDSEPTSTDVLWLDTDEEPDVPVPTGGTDGQVLTKTSSADYATAWENIPEGTTVISSATAPEDTGAIWYDTENGNAYIYYDGFWTSITGLPSIPVGGTTGQVLAKASNTDYATQWIAPPGSALVGSSTFTTQTSVALDNIFSANYRFYDYYFTATGSTGSTLAARLRTASTDLSTSTYRVQTLISDGTTTTSVTDGTTTQWNLSNTRARMFWKHGTITNPFTAESTGFGYFGTDNISDGQLRIDQGVGNNTTASSYDGIRFFVASGTITGQLSIYGRRF
jgi:hypothetical protein